VGILLGISFCSCDDTVFKNIKISILYEEYDDDGGDSITDSNDDRNNRDVDGNDVNGDDRHC
jgi:hypothetical protein